MIDDALVFMDTETLGIDPAAPIWEFAAVRRNGDGSEEEYHWFIHHDPWKHVFTGNRWDGDLPAEFRQDYQRRWDATNAIHIGDLVDMLAHIYRGRAHTVGAVPNFDTERLGRQCRKYGKPEPWHYHLIDIENVVLGYLTGRGEAVPMPWKSDDLSRLVGVEPEFYQRHTAMGDVRWEMAQWDAVMNSKPEKEYVLGARDLLEDLFGMVRDRNYYMKHRAVRAALRDWWTGFEA